MYAYAANNPIKYTDPDGRYLIVKDKDSGNYGLTTAQHGVGWIHYGTLLLSNWVPFGGYVINLEKAISNIDPTSSYTMLYNSDDCTGFFTASNSVDGLSFTATFKNSNIFEKFSKGFSIYGSIQSLSNIKQDKIIEDFIKSQTTDLFSGVINDKSAVQLGKYLAEGALYYNENEKRLKEKGISKSDWGQMIRTSTNNILGDKSFESFEKLEEHEF